MNKIAYNLREAAEATGLSAKTLKRAIDAGKLRAKRSLPDDEKTGKPTGVYLIPAKELEAWIEGLEAA